MNLAGRLLWSAAFCGTPFVAIAQTPHVSVKSDIAVEARLVIVPAVVRDKKGKLLTGLKNDDFALQVDGKPQALRYFDHDSDVPLTVGLLVDTSMSQRAVIDAERTASATFLEKMLAPERDKAFVITFARKVDLLQDVTASRPKLQQALKELDTAKPSFDRSRDSGSSQDDRRERMREMMMNVGTALYDAVFLASDEIINKQPGRRALILLTDGEDHGSKVTLARAIEKAQHANAIVYAIYYKGEQGGFGRPGLLGGGGKRRRGGGFPWMPEAPEPQMGGGRGGPMGGGQQVDGKKILQRMCGETGGRMFEVSKKATVETIYAEIAEELRTQYRLGFTPTAEAASEGYHQVAVSLVGPVAKDKPTLQARDGYYTGGK